MSPKSTVRFCVSPFALVTVGSPPGVSVIGTLRIVAPAFVPLSSLSALLSGSAAGSDPPPVLEVKPAGGTIRTR